MKVLKEILGWLLIIVAWVFTWGILFKNTLTKILTDTTLPYWADILIILIGSVGIHLLVNWYIRHNR